jgi:hypothetical protein
MSSSRPPFALADPVPLGAGTAGRFPSENVVDGDKCDIFACLSDLTDLCSPTARPANKSEDRRENAQAIFQESPPWLPGLPSAWSALSPNILSASPESAQLNDDLRVMLASPAPLPSSQSAISASGGTLLSTPGSLSESLLLSPFVSRLFPDR